MNKSLFIRALCIVGTITVLLFTTACSKETVETELSEPTPSEIQSTTSVLVPVEATFDDKYIKLTSKKGNELNLKGNVAATVSAKSTKQYDPNTFESLSLNETYALSDGLGVGSTCDEFMQHFGITRGYYIAYNKEGKAVDIEVKSKNEFTFVAILKFDESSGKITFVAGGKIGEHAEGLNLSGVEYMSSVAIGKDVLKITLTVKGDLTVKSFDIAHYIL